jgi:Spy/CpxP family protein refolding chaperone
MRRSVAKTATGMTLAIVLLAGVPLAGIPLAAVQVSLAQEAPADNMEILRAKIKADKKLLIATNMDLTASEAKGFWPIYDAYQQDLHKINRQIEDLLESYAADLQGKSLTDAKAKRLITESVTIEQEEAKLRSTYAPKLSKVLPAKKVARYLQIESKIRALVKYDLATGVPLVE